MRPNYAGYQDQRDPRTMEQRDAEFAENLAVGSNLGRTDYGRSDRSWPTPAAQSYPPPSSPPSHPPPRKPPQRPQRPPDPQALIHPPRPASYAETAIPQYPGPLQASHHGSGDWNGDSYASTHHPNLSSHHLGKSPPNLPLPPPIPHQHASNQANRRAPLGPPPSARRGPSHYYPPIAGVHPIEEEPESKRASMPRSIEADTGADMSSRNENSIPIGIGMPAHSFAPKRASQHDTSSSFYDDDEEIESPVEPRMAGPKRIRLSGKEHHAGDPGIAPDEPGLFRQASIGKKSKPVLTTVKRDGRSSGTQTPKSTLALSETLVNNSPRTIGDLNPSKSAEFTTSVSEEYGTPPAEFQSGDDTDTEKRVSSGLFPPALFKDTKASPRSKGQPRSRSPLASVIGQSEVDPITNNMPSHQSEKPASIQSPKPGFSERNDRPRPPRINIDAVREAGTRGSLTSLPDLIRRATRLASNLDRGRTASRLGMMNWMEGSTPTPTDKEKQSRNLPDADKKARTRSAGGISDIIASFPSPQIKNDTGSWKGEGDRRSFANWGGRPRHSEFLGSECDSPRDGKHPRKKGGDGRRRRCCGMPLWLFCLLLILLILLIAAAIIVPISLIVIPRQNGDNNSAAVAQCKNPLSCQNGGANIRAANGDCQCLCVNAYTGSTCTVLSDAGCVSLRVAGASGNTTVGSEIPAVINSAASSFGIPLDEQKLLAVFAFQSLTCSSENALVRFTNVDETLIGGSGRSSKRAEEEEEEEEDLWSAPELVQRQNTASITATSTGNYAAATSNGIVYMTGSPSTAASSGATSSATTSAAPSSSSAASQTGTAAAAATSSTSSPSSTSAQTTLTFARVAIMYILQNTSSLDAAASAQSNLQSYFTNGRTPGNGQSTMGVNPSNVTLGGGWACDLVNLRLLDDGMRVGNGTGS